MKNNFLKTNEEGKISGASKVNYGRVLDKEDHRFFAVQSYGDEIVAVTNAESIDDKTFCFGLPSSVALFLDLALKARIEALKINFDDCFNVHSQGIWPDNHKLLFDFFGLMSGQMCLFYTAIEAFANTMIRQKAPKDFVYRTINKGKVIRYDKYKSEGVRLEVKLDKILPEILKIKSPKGTKIWDGYIALKKFRDRLTHLDSIDLKSSGPEIKTIWGSLIRRRQKNIPLYVYDLLKHYFINDIEPRWLQKFYCAIESCQTNKSA